MHGDGHLCMNDVGEYRIEITGAEAEWNLRQSCVTPRIGKVLILQSSAGLSTII